MMPGDDDEMSTRRGASLVRLATARSTKSVHSDVWSPGSMMITSTNPQPEEVAPTKSYYRALAALATPSVKCPAFESPTRTIVPRSFGTVHAQREMRDA